MMKERMCINYIWYIWTVLEEENIKYKENILFGGFHSKMKQENNIKKKKKSQQQKIKSTHSKKNYLGHVQSIRVFWRI